MRDQAEIQRLNAEISVLNARIVVARFINPSLLYRLLEPYKDSSRIIDWEALVKNHWEKNED